MTDPNASAKIRVGDAIKWLNDLSALGNPNARLIAMLLTGHLETSGRVIATLTGRLAPLMAATIGRDVAKADILLALSPIKDLLGAPPEKGTNG